MRQRSIRSRVLVCTLLAALCVMTAGANLRASILNVPADHSTVQGAVDAAVNGDTVLVAPGTYYENIKIKDKAIVVSSHFMFAKDPEFIVKTILNGSTPSIPDSASVIRITGWVDSSMIVQGFTITGGRGTMWDTPGFPGQPATLGGGILIDEASPIIQYNLIIDNEALVSVSPLSAGGGGIRSGFGWPVIRNNMILNNDGLYGAGINLNFPNGAIITNNVIAGNRALGAFGGGAIWTGFATDIVIVNNTIVNNSDVITTGGIQIIGTGAIVKNSILWGNTGPDPNQVTGGSATVSYCNVQGGSPGLGNIAIEPSLYGIYRYPTISSPGIDAGDPASPTYDDIEDPSTPGSAEWPARGGLRNDMGAYGGPGAFCFDKVFVFLEKNGLGGVPCTVNVETHTKDAITDLHWDFGNGSTDYTLSTSHIYNTWGGYPLSLVGDTGLGTLTTLYHDTAYAMADSMIVPALEGMPGQSVAVEIFARNAPPLYNIIVPLAWSGDLELQFDSVSRAGCRTEFFNVLAYNNYDPGSGHISVRLQNMTTGPGPELATGTGPIVRYWFTVSPSATAGQTASISLEGFGSYQPIFRSVMLSGLSPLSYRPNLSAGSITAKSCCISRGDVNYDSQHKRNVVDLTYLVAYLFQGGAQPTCKESADVNYDSLINVVDLTFMVQFLFNSGVPPPPCP